jgi:hypothetical protein
MSELSVGRSVLVAVDPAINGGVDHAPATVVAVTEVSQDLHTGTVNLQLLQNAPGTRYVTGVPVFADQDAAREWLSAGAAGSVFAAWWPAGQAERDAAIAAVAELVPASDSEQG